MRGFPTQNVETPQKAGESPAPQAEGSREEIVYLGFSEGQEEQAMKKIMVCVFCLAILAGVGSLRGYGLPKSGATSGAPRPAIDAEKIRAHVKFLSSDLLEGRGTGQRGGDIAAEYIATQFSLYGLKPAGENGTFFQDVPMIGVKTSPETAFELEESQQGVA